MREYKDISKGVHGEFYLMSRVIGGKNTFKNKSN